MAVTFKAFLWLEIFSRINGVHATSRQPKGNGKDACLKLHSALTPPPFVSHMRNPLEAEATSDYFLYFPQLLAEHFQYEEQSTGEEDGVEWTPALWIFQKKKLHVT